MKEMIAIASAALAFTSCQKDIKINEWTVSSRDSYFQKVECNVAEESADAKTICIDPSRTAQTMKGFGTCFNELGWSSLQLLTEEERAEIFSELFEPEYYELKHLSHYVKPGAKRLLLDGSTYEDMLGFINPDGTIALVVANQTSEPQSLSIRINGKSINICIGPETFHSILLS